MSLFSNYMGIMVLFVILLLLGILFLIRRHR